MQVGTGIQTINWLIWNLLATRFAEYLLHENVINKPEKRRFDPDHDLQGLTQHFMK